MHNINESTPSTSHVREYQGLCFTALCSVRCDGKLCVFGWAEATA